MGMPMGGPPDQGSTSGVIIPGEPLWLDNPNLVGKSEYQMSEILIEKLRAKGQGEHGLLNVS
jgi:hypothetical protein